MILRKKMLILPIHSIEVEGVVNATSRTQVRIPRSVSDKEIYIVKAFNVYYYDE